MRRFKTLFYIAIFSILSFSCDGQSYPDRQYLKLPDKMVPSDFESNDSLTTYVRIVDFLPKDYKKDGRIDYTSYIQNCLNLHKRVVFPNFPLLVNDRGLNVRSNSVVHFPKGSKLLMKPTKARKYGLINLTNVSNVRLENPNLFGDRFNHLTDQGEWGMGIYIKGADDIHIVNPSIKNCWGDGICIGPIEGRPSSNIRIESALIDNCRRNGISIVSVDGVYVTNSTISNSRLCGIDIEPDKNADILNRVVIEHSSTFNNRSGIQIALGKLVGQKAHEVKININKHIEESSSIGLSIGGMLSVSSRPGHKLVGEVIIDGIELRNNVEPMRIRNNLGRTPPISIRRSRIYKNNKESTSTYIQSLAGKNSTNNISFQ